MWGKGWAGGTIRCNTIQQSEALLKIAKNSEDTTFEVRLIVGDVKKKGWAALGKVAELHGSGEDWRTFNVSSRRDHMLQADREDLKKIWKAMHGGEWGNSWCVALGSWNDDRFFLRDDNDGTFEKAGGNEEWVRLLRVLDMSNEEWYAKWVPIRSRF